MHETLEWIERPVAHGGVVERSFRLGRTASTVPGALWLPSSPVSAPPLVLLGHGGSGHKRAERIVSRARWFASHARIAALAIDGPYHGDRVPAPMAAADYQGRMAAEGIEVVLDRMTDEWRATVDALFHIQWHDEIFPKDGQLALFALLGSRDKQLDGYDGTHSETQPAAVARWRHFISRHLAEPA
jgi:hypothetical protein